jgi:outer membrane protein TolC
MRRYPRARIAAVVTNPAGIATSAGTPISSAAMTSAATSSSAPRRNVPKSDMEKLHNVEVRNRVTESMSYVPARATIRAAVIVMLQMVAAGRAAAQRTLDTLPLSLPEAVTFALSRGEEARIAAAQVDLADAQVLAARASGFPQLRVNGSYTHTYQSARGQAVGSVFNQPNTYSANASFSQPLFQGGRVLMAARAAGQVRGAARLGEADERAQVTLDVQRAYLEAQFADRVLAIREGSSASSGERLAQVERFQAAGRAARYDVLRARVEFANLEPLVLQARADRDLALLAVKQMVNIPADRPIRLTTQLDTSSARVMLASVVGDSSGQGEDRASVRAAELTASARHVAVWVARADLLPTVTLTFQSGFQAFPISGFPNERGVVDVVPCPPGSTPGRICTTQNGGWFSDRSLGAVVSWPLFEGLKTRAGIEVAQAQARVADLEAVQAREAAAVEVAQARLALEHARSLYRARTQNAGEAEEAFHLASLRFDRGLSTQLEVSDSQLALLTARTDEARALFDLHLATAELARALGKPIPIPGSTEALRGARSTEGTGATPRR